MRQTPINKKNRNKFDSYIGWNQSWSTYYFQYKEAVDKIVEMVERSTPIDIISLPLLFLIRHSLELGLKTNIQSIKLINKNTNEISQTNSHSLKVLYQEFEQHLNSILEGNKVSQKIKEEFTSYLKDFEPLKDTLHKIDKGSFNFRYPVDTNGNPNFEKNDKMQVANIIDVFYKIQPLLLYTENVLTEEGIIEDEF